MTTTDKPAATLKGVVAFVDVWSKSRTEDYSKPFIQQLVSMGAEVSKTFNKKVTHVVFKDGHWATWNKAKKTGVKLVSVLWVARCGEDGRRVDEDVYPAVNEENDASVLPKRTHRCMQPRDIPVRTPENNKRMRKKLDKLMADLIPTSPIVSDASPFIIDEESGIVYSPSSRRADAMARRLKEMREKRENLSPTASQMVESSLAQDTALKPSLGSTPKTSFIHLLEEVEKSSDGSSNAVCASAPNKNKGKQGQIEQCNEMSTTKTSCEGVSDKALLVNDNLESKPSLNNQAGRSLTIQGKKPRRSSARHNGPKNQSSIESYFFNSASQNGMKTQYLLNLGNENLEKSSHRSKSKSVLENDKLGYNFSTESECTVPATNETSEFAKDRRTSLDAFIKAPWTVNTALPATELPHGISESAEAPLKLSRQRRGAGGLERTADSCSALSSRALEDDVFEDYFSPANSAPRQRSVVLKPTSDSKLLPAFGLGAVSGSKRSKARSESEGSSTRKRKRREIADEELIGSAASSSGKSAGVPPPSKAELGAPAPKRERPTPAAERKRTKAGRRSDEHSPPGAGTAGGRGTSAEPSAPPPLDPPEASRDPRARPSPGSPSPPESGTTTRISCFKNLGRGNKSTTDGHSEGSSEMGSKKTTTKTDKCTKTKRTLVMTSMPSEKQQTVLQVVESLGGFDVAGSVCEGTTHVVAGSPRRTLNVLLGIARGCWILSFEWILWSLEHGQWLPEEPYELSDRFPAAPICRLQQHLSAGEHQQDLFQSQPPMFVSPLSQPPCASLMELIQLCGGTVSRSIRQAGVCIGEYRGKKPEGTRSLSEQWVLDSVTHLTLLPYENYDLEWRSP